MSEPMLIAEFCQNHNGDFDVLRRMIDAAAEAGATHGKIQTIFAEDLSFRPEFEEGSVDAAGRRTAIRRPYQAEYDRLKGLELTYRQHEEFVDSCHRAGLEPLTTVFTAGSIPKVKDLGWRCVKVASYDCGSLPFVELLAGCFDELIVSTGASYDGEIESCAAILRDLEKPFVMLHCVTIYPTPLEVMNLRRLDYLRRIAPKVGLSDHSKVSTDGIKSALMAIHLGAQAIERHFTILNESDTRDGPVSIRPEHIAEMSAFSKMSKSDQHAHLLEAIGREAMDAMLGTADRTMSEEELLNRGYYRGRFCTKVSGRQVFNWEEETRTVASSLAG